MSDYVVNALGQPVGLSVPDWHGAQTPEHATLPGRFCRLEPLEPQRHAAALYAANRAADDALWTYLPYGPFASESDYLAWMTATCCGSDPAFFAIVDTHSDCAVGLAAYLRIAPQAGSIEVGHLAFAPALQRTPAATEAMYLMMAHAFARGYRRYEWKCNALNAPSRRAAQRLGFSFEGVFRQAAVVKGHNRDTAWYAIIDSEWPALRAAFERWLAPDNFTADGRQKTRLSALTAPLLHCTG